MRQKVTFFLRLSGKIRFAVAKNGKLRYNLLEIEEGRTKVNRFPSRILGTVAAVLALVLILAAGSAVTAEAFHIDIWGKLANWTKEIFQFTDMRDGTMATNPEKENNLELKSLHDALAQYKVSEKLVPAWMPKGYTCQDLQTMNTPRVLNILF